MKEANEALAARDFEVARSRAMQARALDAAWDIWDVTPEQMLTQIDNADGAKTFLADEKTQVADSADANFAKARHLVAQAKEAISNGQHQTALELANQADALKAPYGLFDETPQTIRDEIAQLG